jgi:hypothetical protein
MLEANSYPAFPNHFVSQPFGGVKIDVSGGKLDEISADRAESVVVKTVL